MYGPGGDLAGNARIERIKLRREIEIHRIPLCLETGRGETH
jgi:hypothetical protein